MVAGDPGAELHVTRGGDAGGRIQVSEAMPAAESAWVFSVVPHPPLPRRAHAAADGTAAMTAPLAGTIASVRVAKGDNVESGQVLATLEAMKMEHRITATADGTVKAVHIAERDVVREGDLLFELE